MRECGAAHGHCRLGYGGRSRGSGSLPVISPRISWGEPCSQALAGAYSVDATIGAVVDGDFGWMSLVAHSSANRSSGPPLVIGS